MKIINFSPPTNVKEFHEKKHIFGEMNLQNKIYKEF